MEVKKLQKLQKHLKTLKLFKIKKDTISMSLPKKGDATRFAMHNWKFNCGMPACVAGHAKYIFKWNWIDCTWKDKFKRFFNLSYRETNWIIDTSSYKSINPTPATAAKHIQDVLDGKFNEKTFITV